MTQKIYVVEGRKFRTEADYQNALKDQQVIENLRVQTKKMSLADQKKLLEVIRSGKCRFHSILGQDYMEELSEEIKRQEAPKISKTTHEKKETFKKKEPIKKEPIRNESVPFLYHSGQSFANHSPRISVVSGSVVRVRLLLRDKLRDAAC